MAEMVTARGLTALREATYNTDAGLSTSNGLEFVEATLSIEDAYDGNRDDVVHGAAGSLPPAKKAGRTVNITIRGEMKGRGSAYTNVLTQWPLYHVVLGCALSGSLAGGQITLSGIRPDRSGSFTLGFYSASNFHKITGCRGSLSFNASAPARGFWEFTGNGVLGESYPVAMTLPTITYPNQSVEPPVFMGAAATLHSWTPVIESYRFEIRNVISPRLDGNATTGHSGFILTNRSVGWQFPGEAVSISDFNPFSTSLSGTTGALNLTQGQDTGNKFTYAMPATSVTTPVEVDSSGKLVWDLKGGAHITSGNDEITIVAG